MELRILNTFLKVAQLQSFSKAADSLGYSQSAITVQVQQLENELGVRLFEYGSAVNATRNIIALSREPMERLTKAANESASLSMLDRGEALVLSHAEADSGFHIVSETGAHLPAFCTAQGKVLLSFTVDTDGSVIDAKVLRGAHPVLDAEALRVIESCKEKWTPGMMGGKPVRVKYIFPVIFQLR